MSITVDPADNHYDLAELRLDTEVVICEDFNFEISSEPETKTATNSRDPVGYKGGKNEYSFEANGVAPEYLKMLREYQAKQKNFPAGIFNFDDDGDYREVGTLLNCRISSINWSHEDEGSGLDISGVALSFKDKS